MIRKSDLSLRIGMTMLVLCATLLLTVLPAAADYDGDHNLNEALKGTVTGGMNYTIGNSTYSPKLWSYNTTGSTGDSYFSEFTPEFPDALVPTTSKARLYVYYTYSFIDNNSSSYDIGVEPTMTVTFDGNVLTRIADYSDWKDEANAGNTYPYWNYPSGTYVYDVTDYVNATNSGDTYVVDVTNTKPYYNDPNTTGNDSAAFNIQAIGLLTLYNDSGYYDYFIDEGNDLTYLKTTSTDPTVVWQDGRVPEDTKTLANFENVNTDNMYKDYATLVTAAPSAGTIYNSLFVNDDLSSPAFATGVWDGSPRDKDFSYNTTNIPRSYLTSGVNNSITFMNGLDDENPGNDGQMQAANAFLMLLKKYI